MNHTVKGLAQERSIVGEKKQEIKKKANIIISSPSAQETSSDKRMEHLHTAEKNKKHKKMEISFSETSAKSSDHYGDSQGRHARPTGR